jgi:hypothetical protein
LNPIVLLIVGGFAVLFTAMASYIAMPIEDDIYLKNQNLTNTRGQEVSQTQHSVYVIAPPAFVGAIFMSLFMWAGRRSRDEVYE